MADGFGGAKPKVPRVIRSNDHVDACRNVTSDTKTSQIPGQQKVKPSCQPAGLQDGRQCHIVSKPCQKVHAQSCKKRELAGLEKFTGYCKARIKGEDCQKRNAKPSNPDLFAPKTSTEHVRQDAKEGIHNSNCFTGVSGSLQDTDVQVDVTDSASVSSGSLDGDWRQISPGANQEADNWSCGCECTRHKCNCDGDWSFKVPSMCDDTATGQNLDRTKAQPCVGTNKTKQQKKFRRNKRISKERAGLLDNAFTSSDDDQFEFVFDERYGEIVRRKKLPQKKNEETAMPAQSLQKGPQNSNTDSENSKHAVDVSPLDTLKHALPYLPERLRNRLAALRADQSSTSDQSGGADTTKQTDGRRLVSTKGPVDAELSPPYLKGRNSSELRECGADAREIDDNRNSIKTVDDHKTDSKSRSSDGEKCNTVGRWYGRGDTTVRWINEDVDTFEHSLEDPFKVKDVESVNLCSGLINLIDDIDLPLVGEFDSDYSSSDKVMPSPVLKHSEGHNSGIIGGHSKELGEVEGEILDDAAGAIREEDDEEEDGGLLSADTVEDQMIVFASRMEGLCSGIRKASSAMFGTNQDVLAVEEATSDRDLQITRSPRSTSDEVELWQSGSDLGGESCDEADDEFECDCETCSLLCHPPTSDPDFDLGEDRDFMRQERWDEMRYGAQADLPSVESLLRFPDDVDDETGLGIEVLEPASLGLLLDSSLRQIVLIESVIQQMLTIQPDLLTSPATPAAPQSVIDSLPTLTLTTQCLEQHPTCPICLSPCEVDDLMAQLPCQHLFHPACVRAWLAKSGTCPVCRQSVVG